MTGILEAWAGWAEEHRIEGTSISIGFQGVILASDGRGRDPKTAYPLASLTKAITAVCLESVFEEQNLSISAPLGEFNEAFAAADVTIPNSMRDRSLAEIITMTAGLEPDQTQGRFDDSAQFGRDSNSRFSKLALGPRGLKGKRGTYFYNNGSYAVLGALLEGLTGTDTVTACRDRVFPEGHRETADVNPDWAGLGAFGGWQASTRDYTAFGMAAFNPEGDIATRLFDLPFYADPTGWHYGLGIHFRVIDGQNVFWHRGALCRIDGEEQGTYFAYYGTGYAVTVTYNACGQGDVARGLDHALFRAAQL